MLKAKLLDVAIVALIIGGLGVLAAPFVSDAWVSYQNQQVIARYRRRESAKNHAALAREYRHYQALNRQLAQAAPVPGVARFSQAVNARGTAHTGRRAQATLTAATIAQLTVPKLGLSLPVFDHTSDALLQFGACRLDGTSYPTGGTGTRAVLSAHRGVPNATLFTDLPRLRKGDRFFIHIGDHTLAYRVARRQVIRPSEVAALAAVPGQDLVTLMTCTPYMVNSHRLLVTGVRVPYTRADAAAAARAGRWNRLKLWLWGLAAVALIVLGWGLVRGLRRRRPTSE